MDRGESGSTSSEKEPPRRWWSRLPTPVVVAVLGAALSAWFIPAITRQWQDQQKSRELKASLVTKIGQDTTDALVTSDFLAYGRLPLADSSFNELDLTWRRNSEEIEGLLTAYFPSVVREWRRYAWLVKNTYFLLRPRDYLRVETLARLRAARLGTDAELRLVKPWFMDAPTTASTTAYYNITVRLLDAKRAITAKILHAHAAGYSQGPVDFFRDLLPFL